MGEKKKKIKKIAMTIPLRLSDVISAEVNHKLNRTQIHTKYNNGYGASVVKGPGTYGYEEDKWEVAVLLYDKYDSPSLCYDTPITDDVIGWLDDASVIDICNRIKELPPA